MITLAYVQYFQQFFTVEWRKELQKELKLKLPLPLISVAVHLAKIIFSAVQISIHINWNYLLNIRQLLLWWFLLYFLILIHAVYILTTSCDILLPRLCLWLGVVAVLLLCWCDESLPSVPWHCWLGGRKGLWRAKKLKCCYSSGDDETGALTIATSIVSFVSKIQNGLTLWYWPNPFWNAGH